MFGGEGWLAVYGDGGPGGAQALGLMLRSFARKLSPQAWKWTVLRETDRGHKGRVPQKRKKTEKDFVKNGKKESAKKEKRLVKRAGKVR